MVGERVTSTTLVCVLLWTLCVFFSALLVKLPDLCSLCSVFRPQPFLIWRLAWSSAAWTFLSVHAVCIELKSHDVWSQLVHVKYVYLSSSALSLGFCADESSPQSTKAGSSCCGLQAVTTISKCPLNGHTSAVVQWASCCVEIRYTLRSFQSGHSWTSY